jgi:CTP synthase
LTKKIDCFQVINVHDCPTIYHVPLVLYEQGLAHLLSSKLCLKMPVEKPRKFMSKWRHLAERVDHLRKVQHTGVEFTK